MIDYAQAIKNIPPEHDIRLIRKRFETFESAGRERETRINMLLGSGLAEDKAVAKTLQGCKKGRRCWSAACPVCMRIFRIWLYAQESKIFPSRFGVRIITLIIPDRLCKAEELLSLSVSEMESRLRTQKRRAGFKGTIIMGGFEIDFDERLQRWVPHFHLIVDGSTKAARKLLRKRHYQKTKKIKRPMKVQKVKKRARQFSYCLKSYASLKVSYRSKKTGKKETRKKRLKQPQHNLALRFFAQYKPQDLTFMLGVRQDGYQVHALPGQSEQE